MHQKKILRVVALAAMAMMTLSACGGAASTSSSSGSTADGSSAPAQSGEKVELTFSHYYLEEDREASAPADVYLTLINQWQEAHPDVTLTQSVMTQADYATKIQAQAAVNELPDLFFLKGSWVSNFADSDLLKPINSSIDAYDKKDSFRDNVFDAATRDGNIYGLPNQLSITSVVFYNEQLWKDKGYDTFPDNYADILAAGEKFSADGVAAIALGNKDIWPAESTILSTLGDRYTGMDWTNSLIAKDGAAKFTDPEFISALTMLQSMATSKVFNPDFNTISDNQAQEYYCQGKAAAIVDGHWTLSYLQANATEDVLNQTRVAILPMVDGGKGQPNMISGGCGWYVSLNNALEGAKLDAATSLLFDTTGYGLSELYATKYGLAGPAIIENVDMSSFSQLTRDFDALTGSITFSPIYDMRMDGSVIEVMNTGLQEILNNTKTPEDLAEQIQTAHDKTLQ